LLLLLLLLLVALVWARGSGDDITAMLGRV
jgi:hypothetical protein